MHVVLAFDVYGTLIDTAGVVAALAECAGERAGEFSAEWRRKQLEYSFRRAAMREYRDFAVCTRQSLDHTCALFGIRMSGGDKDSLLDLYQRLPAFPDAPRCLSALKDAGYDMYAFSNGRAEDIRSLLGTADIAAYFKDSVSTGEMESFKPDPNVYRHFLKRAHAAASGAWMISSNPFDVIGALHAGMRAAWVRRAHNAVFDPWGYEPAVTVDGLAELPEALGKHAGGL